MPPNILFILADQHNARVLGHRGHPDVQTGGAAVERYGVWTWPDGRIGPADIRPRAGGNYV